MSKIVSGIVSDVVVDIIKSVSKQFGFIEDSHPVNMNGRDGFIIWDYILYNEITFVDSADKSHTSLYTSFSDTKTRNKFNELVEKFGQSENQ